MLDGEFSRIEAMSFDLQVILLNNWQEQFQQALPGTDWSFDSGISQNQDLDTERHEARQNLREAFNRVRDLLNRNNPPLPPNEDEPMEIEF